MDLMSLFLLVCSLTPSKEKEDADDRLELARKGVDGDDGSAVEGVADIPWEKRYEKLWVEVEKKEVKSTFKSVAGELKERFGELFKSRRPPENTTAEETSPSSSAEEESSDEDEVIVRPAARARSSVLFTIPEQRESGQEDSAAEHPDSQSGEENLEGGEEPGGDGNGRGGSDLLSAAAPNSASLLLTTTEKESEDGFKSFNDKSQDNHLLESILKDQAADSSEGNRSPDGTDHRAEELQERRRSQLDPAASEELKGSMGSWKLETGNGLPLSREKETKFKTEVEGCPSSLLFSGLNSSLFFHSISFFSIISLLHFMHVNLVHVCHFSFHKVGGTNPVIKEAFKQFKFFTAVAKP